MNAHRLLLVEDEFLIRMTLSEALSDAGFDVVEAEDGEAALARLDGAGRNGDGAFSIMLTDIQLPGSVDGRALAQHARAVCPDLPVIFMSGRPDAAASENPLDTYIGKPYLPSAVSATIRRILDGG